MLRFPEDQIPFNAVFNALIFAKPLDPIGLKVMTTAVVLRHDPNGRRRENRTRECPKNVVK